MKIVNITDWTDPAYAPPGNPGWQLWDGNVLVGVYRTRDQARSEARAREM